MKNSLVRRVVSPVTYFLSILFLLLCLLGQPARATVPSGLTLTGVNIGTGTGGESYDAGTDSFTVTGNGDGFWFGAGMHPDNDHFSYTTATGDVEIVARLVSFSTPGNGQAGLMIRQSNSTNEFNKAVTFFWYNVNGSNQVAYEGNGPSTGGNAYYYNSGGYTAKAALTLPYWLKLVRVGNNYGAYWSLNGRDWNLIANNSGGALFGTGTFNVGFFVDDFLGYTGLSTAVFDNVYIGAPRLQYKTSWIGNTSSGLADGYASNHIHSLWVKGDGTCYANSAWDESAQSVKAYKDGKVAFAVPVTGMANSGLTEGTITGNTNNLFIASNNPVAAVYRTDFNGQNATTVTFTTGLGKVGGLAANDTRLFVSDTTNQNVRIVDLTMSPPTQIGLAATAGNISHPGPIAYDGTNFWITDCGSAFPLTNYVAPTTGYTAAIKCFDSTGALVTPLRQITDVSNPTALAKHPTMDRLYVCDNGPNQNVRYYSGLAGTPIYAGSFGVTGGIWNSTSPGTIYEAGNGDYRRFYGPTGVGVDSSGNIYVACNGTNYSGTDLRKFDSAGTLVWKQQGLEFVNVGDFDPGSDTIYTTEERFTMNYANTAPGSEWSYTAFTRSPFKANDVRNAGGAGVNGVQIRRLTTGNNVFMYTDRQGTAEPCAMFRFNNQNSSFQGTTATPYGRIYNHTSAPAGFKLWIDTNADGLEATDGSEYTDVTNSLGGYTSYDVDSGGDIWMAGLATKGIGRLPCTGTQTIGTSPNTALIPQYNPAGSQFFLCPAPIQVLQSIKYDRAHDVMYCMGQKTDGKWALARYDNWLACPTPDDHPARYVTPLPDNATDITLLAPPGTSPSFKGYMGMAFAGDKIFIADMWGPIRVYDANLGNPVITLNPGPEISATMGWEDMMMGLNATKRSNGEYLIQESDTGGRAACTLLYRWTPTADTTVPDAPTQLTATAQGHAIALTWTGPSGTPTSYNIYRGTTSGSLTLYQSNVNTAAYVDTNVAPGTTYYYTVAAVSTVGTGAQSNQASATPVSTQAEFVKYDTTTQGTWNPTGTRVYGADGYSVPGQTASLPPYVSNFTPVHTSVHFFATDPVSDVRFPQIPSGATRTSAFYSNSTGSNEQSYDITFADSSTWHQVSIYMMYWTLHPRDVKVEVSDKTTGAVLDTREPMDTYSGKWLVWNVRGAVTIRLTKVSDWPVVNGIFFDAVQTSTPALGWWKLDETSGTIAADSSGAGYNATKSGGTWTAGAHTGFNGCLTYGGTNATSNLSMGAFNPTNAPKITYAMWFKTATSGVMLGMWNAGPTAFAPVLYVGTDNKLHGAFYTGVIQNMKSTASVNDNTWHHAALSCDGQTQTLYLDGEVVGMLSAPVSQLTSNWYYFNCGQGYVTGWPNLTGTQAYFNGQVDDLRLYNRVLSNSEIWKLNN